MNNVYEKKDVRLSQKLCLMLVWIITIYSSVIQQKYFSIPNGMLIFGIIYIICFLLSINKTQISYNELMPKETLLQFLYLVYMCVFVSLYAVSVDAHFAQLINILEYFLIMILTAYTISKTRSDSIHTLLLVIAAWLALIMVFDPVSLDNGRYSVALHSNPNGIGMSISIGIWSVLYFQKKKHVPIFLAFGIVGLLGYAILLTGSRKSLIAGGAIIILWLVFVYLPGLKRDNVWIAIMKTVVIIGIMITMCFLFFREYSGSVIEQRMGYLMNEATEGDRNSLYMEGIEIFKKHPIFGIGFQGYRYYFGSYSHSTIIEVPVSGGLIGVLLYFSSFVISMKRIIRLMNRTKKDEEAIQLNDELKMLLILWVIILFYCVCVIHPYQYDSYILFALIFGQTSSITNLVNERTHFNYVEN